MPDLRTGNYIQKFYKNAGVVQAGSGFQVTLDGRGIHTPERQPFTLPSYPLALAIAAEWQQQEKFLKPHTMPLMQMSATAIDLQTTGLRDSLVDRILSFLMSDSVCFRDGKSPLGQRQEEQLQPVLKYLSEKYQLLLPISPTVAPPEVPEGTIEKLRSICTGLDDYHMVALETASTISKSTALGLSLLDSFLPIQSILKLSRLEEDYQAEVSGKVEGAHDLEEAHCLMLLSAAKCLTHLKSMSS